MKDMSRKIFGASLIAGAILLSGCTTPEMRSDSGTASDLSFYSETKPPEQAVSQGKTGAPSAEKNNILTNKKMYTNPPEMALDQSKQYTATLKTDAGDIVVKLAAAETPITVNNFVFLAREKFYDGTIFHRVIKGFMIQGGDPEGTGMGGPGYKFGDEPFAGEYVRGTVAMANAGPDTNGSQFFIMHGDNALPPNYVIFGTVASGMEAVDKIALAATKPGGEGSSPVTPIQVRTIEISEK